MNIFSIFAAVGLLAIAGACGAFLGWMEKHFMEDNDEW